MFFGIKKTKPTKAFCCAILIVFFCFFFVAFDSSYLYAQTVIFLKIGSHKASVNNYEKILDVAPFLYHQRTMVPLRFVGESFGADIEWIASRIISGQGIIIIDFPHFNKRIKMHSQIPVFFIETYSNEKEEIFVSSHEMDVAPFIVKPQNRTVVPLRFVAEAMGAKVEWNSSDHSIVITYEH